MPRVLIAHPSADAYGADLQVLESARGLQDAGWDVEVHLPARGPMLALAEGLAVRVHPFPVVRKSLLNVPALLLLAFRMPAVLLRLVRAIRRARADLVYVNTVTVPWWVVAARLARVPVVLHVHEAEREVSRPIAVALNAPGLLADAVIANSEYSAQVAAAAVPRLTRRTRVVFNGVPDHGAQPRHAETADGGAQIVYVGRLSPRKGTDVALEAIALLRADGRDVSLEVCGSVFAGYEWFETQLRERAAAPDLDGAVRFVGHVMPTSPVLARADVVVVPSRVEPFGNTAVEAMLAERPVVVSEVGGLAEIVTNGRTGRVVPPGDPRALADAVAGYLDDRGGAHAVATRARADAVARFSSKRYREDIAALAREVVRRRDTGVRRDESRAVPKDEAGDVAAGRRV